MSDAPASSESEPPSGPRLKGFALEVWQTLSLAGPMILGLLGTMLLFAIDTAMIGRVSVTAVAASQFASALFQIPLIAGFGINTAMHVLAARASSEGGAQASEGVLRSGTLVAVLYAGFWAIFFTWGSELSRFLGQPETVVEEAIPYLQMIGWSMIPTLGYHALRSYAEATRRPWLSLLVLPVGLVVNILGNWVFIWGLGPIPAMGLTGAGLATILARVVMLLMLLWLLRRDRSQPLTQGIFSRTGITQERLRRYLGVGVPSGLQVLIGTTAFALVSVFMGQLGKDPLAAHSIVQRLTGFTFMLPLGIAFATSIRISRAAGEGDMERVRAIGKTSFQFTAGSMVVAALLLVAGRDALPALFLGVGQEDAPAVLQIASLLLIIAAAGQVGDGLQVVANSALRGLTDVKIPLLLTGLIYWGFSIPLGYWMAFPREGGAPALWWSIVIGLTIATAALLGRFYLITRPIPKS